MSRGPGLAPDGNGLPAGDGPDGPGLGSSFGWGDEEPGVGSVGDGETGWLALTDGDRLGDRVTWGAELVGVRVGLSRGWTDPAGAVVGLTHMYSTNTATNRPMSTSVETRGRLLMRHLRSRGPCRGRPRR